MINLLPNDQKREIRAGRANRLLARYSILTFVTLLILIAIMVVAWMLLDNIRQDAQAKIDASNASNASLAKDVAAVEEFKTNLSVAKEILSKEVNYSTIILRYASTIPSGAIIDHIDLDPSVVGTPSTFTAKVITPDSALRLKEALSESAYFDNVHFTQIQTDPVPNGPYAYTVIFNLTINKDLLVEEAQN
jgi:hypothetical protein